MPIWMPKDTREALGAGANHCESRSLLFDRFPFYDGATGEYRTSSFCLFTKDGANTLGALIAATQQALAKETKPDRKESLRHKLDALKPLLPRQPDCFVQTRKAGGPADLKVKAWRAWLGQITASPLKAATIVAQLQSRLMVNMAGGVMENAGLCLDRFGVPYIPGSAVKGCARRMAIQNLLEAREAREPTEKLARLLADIALVFGWGEQDWKTRQDIVSKLRLKRDDTDEIRCQESWKAKRSDFAYAVEDGLWGEVATAARMLLPNTDHFAGTVSFLPAYPHHLPANDLELDIVTCHHPRYYRADPDMPVALDIEEPNPVVFPAVAAGVVFQFAILPIHRAWLGLVGQVSDLTVPGVSDSVGTPGGIASAAPTNKAGSQGPEASATGRPEVCSTAARLLTRAREWLRQGLETFGLGAKTAAGYGWFAEVDATGATPTTSRPQPSSAGLPVAAPATPAATEHPLVTQWRGKTQPANFRAFRPALAALKDDAELKRVFQAIMPVGELSKLKRANPYWQSFVSHPEGGAILKRLKLELR